MATIRLGVLPFEGFRPGPVPRRCCHRRCCLSWGHVLFGVLMCNRLVGPMGFPLPLCSRRFRRSWRFLPAAVPRSLAQAGSSSRKLRSPSESCRSVPARRLPASSTSLGVGVPSSRHQPSASFAQPGFHPRPPFRPWRFSRLRRLSPPLALWVYFTPQPRSGSPFRG